MSMKPVIITHLELADFGTETSMELKLPPSASPCGLYTVLLDVRLWRHPNQL